MVYPFLLHSPFSRPQGWGADFEESKKVFDLYVEKGGNFIGRALSCLALYKKVEFSLALFMMDDACRWLFLSMNFADTANVYTGGTSERFVGELVAPIRSSIVVATKYSLNLPPAPGLVPVACLVIVLRWRLINRTLL